MATDDLSVTAVGAGADLARVTNPVEAGMAMQGDAVSRGVETALSRALSLPGAAPAGPADTVGVMNGRDGPVGAEKSAVVSGDHTQTDAVADPLAGVSARLRGLYSEMTHWQVAWSIAQRTQQDTNHLLKGN